MSRAVANGIQIEYETLGDSSARPLLLIGGLADQLIHWDDDLCRDLSQRGHYVIRFDNRELGLSTKFDHAGVPDLGALVRGEKASPYNLEDVADDAVGLLDAIDIRRAHTCGASMGGMIAQTITIRHPSRVLSLISIYSTTVLRNRGTKIPKGFDHFLETNAGRKPLSTCIYRHAYWLDMRIKVNHFQDTQSRG